jgi:MSHA biogenesis protein MshO
MSGATRKQSGFSLIELIVVIVITGIVATMVAKFVGGPINAFMDTSRRAQLVDSAELALRRMARDVRRALPNSIRIGNSGQTLELLHIVDAARYRDDPPPGGASNILSFSSADNQFSVIGTLQNFANIDTTNDQLVIYNLTASGTSQNAYFGDNRATLDAATTSTNIVLTSATLFPLASPRQRFFISDTPISYVCDNGDLLRYYDYAITSDHTTIDSRAELDLLTPVSSALMTQLVTSCTFQYQAGSSARAGLVTVELTLSEAGESVTLLHQIHVINAP